MIAGGAAAHSDHGRSVAKTLLSAAKNPQSGYAVKDVGKLNSVALALGLDIKGKAK